MPGGGKEMWNVITACDIVALREISDPAIVLQASPSNRMLRVRSGLEFVPSGSANRRNLGGGCSPLYPKAR
jgi:hypothetical protein